MSLTKPNRWDSMDKASQALMRPAVRYLIIGGSVYIFELLIIIIASALGASPVVAVAYSYTLGTLVSFGLQKFVTFGDKRTHHRIILSQLLATCGLVLFNFCFTLLVAKLLEGSVPTVIIRTIALGITTTWNFYLYKTRIFKTDTQKLALI